MSRQRGRYTGLSVVASDTPFWAYLLGGLALFAVLWAFLVAVGAAKDPLLLLVIIVPGSLLLWAMLAGMGESSPVDWVPKTTVAEQSSPAMSTARLADDIERAAGEHPGASHTIATLLADAAEHRLVTRHGADPDDPFAAANGLLSPAFLHYLADVLVDRKPAPLSRKSLDRYLEEIDSL